MHEALALSLTELIARLRMRKLGPVELMEAVLDRIDETQPDLNAFTALRDRDALIEDARKAEARLSRGEGGALEGIPLGVKELEAAEGLPHTSGSLVFKDRFAEEDEIQIARLREAGAIVVGKTNAPEFGYTAITKNLVYGVTRSPWDLTKTPGGSSGGSAAALAGCVCPLVTASDGGGSVRIPASFSGAFGLKPSFGRIPKGPFAHWDFGDTVHYGPLTKTVADAALYLDVAAGPSSLDPDSLPAAGFSYVEALAEPLPRLRIGYSPDLGYGVVQSDVAVAVEEAVGVLESLGHEIVPVESSPPRLEIAWAHLGGFLLACDLHEHLPEREDDFGRGFLSGVKLGFEMSPQRMREMGDGRVALVRWTAELFDDVDLFVTPTVPFDPPDAKGPFPAETEGRKNPPAAVATFTIPWNLTGHPAATVRAGLSKAGLPIGMQLVGPRHADDLVLCAAQAFERERPWHPQWPSSW